MNRNVLPVWGCNPCGTRSCDPTCWMCGNQGTDLGATTSFVTSREGGGRGQVPYSDPVDLGADPCGSGPSDREAKR